MRPRIHAPALARPLGSARGLEPARARTVSIVCWALGESIVIYGLVLGLPGRNLTTAAPFFAWGVALLLLLRLRADLFAWALDAAARSVPCRRHGTADEPRDRPDRPPPA